MKNKAICIKADDWEMLYINGELKEENHKLHQGTERVEWFIEVSDKYNFDLREIEFKTLNEEDSQTLEDYGCAKTYLDQYTGDYR